MQEIIITLIATIILDFLIQTLIFKVKYSQTPLKIKTFDGSDQPYHPSVMYSANGWNGFQYWMVLTPYPMQKAPYKDRWSVHASIVQLMESTGILLQTFRIHLTTLQIKKLNIKISFPIHIWCKEITYWNVGIEYHIIVITIEILTS